MKTIKRVTACSFVCMLSFMLSVDGMKNDSVVYEHSGSCSFTQECVYKYNTAQYSFGEEEREKLFFSTDVHWHCESSGTFGTQPANEYCFTLSNANVISSVGFDLNYTANYTTEGQQPNDTMALFIEKELKGEFCYIQINGGRIVSVHFSPTENHQSLNIKKGIAAVFQANFDHAEEIEESDPGSTHISHYEYSKTSSRVVSFTRSITSKDLIEISGSVPDNSVDYTKQEKSTFINKILYSSRGMLKARIDYGQKQDSESPDSDTFNSRFHFDKEIETNGTYMLTRKYCKQRKRRNFIFADLGSSDIQKDTLKALMNMAPIDQQKMHKIRRNVPSITRFLEELRRKPNNTQLVDALRELLALEAKYGPPPQSTPAIEQIADYYKKIRLSNKPEDAAIRRIIYSFFSTDGSVLSQKILASSLLQKVKDEEKNVLLYQLMQLSNAGLHLVNTIISTNPSNDDNIILVLGALGRNSNTTVQKYIVDELLKRLSEAIITTNNTDTLSTLTYALGNSGSKLAIDALLSSLEHDDIDVQISAIRSLGYHLDQPIVQDAFIVCLSLTDEDKVLEEILMAMVDAFDSTMILTNPSKELLNATVSCAIKLKNPNLYELLINYLQKINDDVEFYLTLLKQQHNYGEVDREHISDASGIDSRVKRGSDWDEYNPDYDVVASYSQRKDDVTNYPHNEAYIWGKTYGVDKLNVKVGAGAFIGTDNTYNNFRVYAKGVARMRIFGITHDFANLEYSDYTTRSELFNRIYLKLGAFVAKSDFGSIKIYSCNNINKNLWNTGVYTVFNSKFRIFVFVGTLSVYLRGYISSRADIDLCLCPSKVYASGNVEASLNLQVNGGASASLLFLVRGGIEVSATINYRLRPEVYVQGSSGGFHACLSLYHAFPDSYIDIYPWHQTRTIRRWRVRWGNVHRWDTGARKWSIPGGETLLWQHCPSPTYSYYCAFYFFYSNPGPYYIAI